MPLDKLLHLLYWVAVVIRDTWRVRRATRDIRRSARWAAEVQPWIAQRETPGPWIND